MIRNNHDPETTDFDNEGINNLEYFYYQFGANEKPITTNGIVNISFGDPNTCPSEFFQRLPLDTQVVNDLKQEYYDTKNDYTRLGAKYQTHPTDAIADTMNLYRLEMDEAAYLMTLHIKNDTLSPYVPDSLYTWISNFDSYEGDLWLAREHLASGNPSMANQVFNGIPSKYTLTTAQQSDLNNYAAIANLIGTTSVYELDATALTALRS